MRYQTISLESDDEFLKQSKDSQIPCQHEQYARIPDPWCTLPNTFCSAYLLVLSVSVPNLPVAFPIHGFSLWPEKKVEEIKMFISTIKHRHQSQLYSLVHSLELNQRILYCIRPAFATIPQPDHCVSS